jgi:hypothetical protein
MAEEERRCGICKSGVKSELAVIFSTGSLMSVGKQQNRRRCLYSDAEPPQPPVVSRLPRTDIYGVDSGLLVPPTYVLSGTWLRDELSFGKLSLFVT